MLELSLNSILFLNLWYRLTLEHYVPPPKFCLFAQTCNHTWIPVCGFEINLKHNKMFLDECDMFEYNCDNQKVYFQNRIDNNCSDETSNNPTQSSPMEYTSITTVDTSTTTEMTTTKIATTIQETASDVTTENKTNLTDSTTQTTITSELTISETNTAQTTNATISTIQTTTEILTSESKNVANETKSILTSCTARPFKVTIPQSSLNKNISLSTNTTEEITITISSTPSSSQKDMPFVETTTTTSETQTSFNPGACEMYPKHCDRPMTWETTLKGETRDFFQILKTRFGNRFRILEDTTHWPRRATPHINDVDDDFQFGHHIKGKEFDEAIRV